MNNTRHHRRQVYRHPNGTEVTLKTAYWGRPDGDGPEHEAASDVWAALEAAGFVSAEAASEPEPQPEKETVT